MAKKDKFIALFHSLSEVVLGMVAPSSECPAVCQDSMSVSPVSPLRVCELCSTNGMTSMTELANCDHVFCCFCMREHLRKSLADLWKQTALNRRPINGNSLAFLVSCPWCQIPLPVEEILATVLRDPQLFTDANADQETIRIQTRLYRTKGSGKSIQCLLSDSLMALKELICAVYGSGFWIDGVSKLFRVDKVDRWINLELSKDGQTKIGDLHVKGGTRICVDMGGDLKQQVSPCSACHLLLPLVWMSQGDCAHVLCKLCLEHYEKLLTVNQKSSTSCLLCTTGGNLDPVPKKAAPHRTVTVRSYVFDGNRLCYPRDIEISSEHKLEELVDRIRIDLKEGSQAQTLYLRRRSETDNWRGEGKEIAPKTEDMYICCQRLDVSLREMQLGMGDTVVLDRTGTFANFCRIIRKHQ